MNIIVEDIGQIGLLENISRENLELYSCPYITEADLRCYYGNECRRAKCHYLFHDIKSCNKKCRFYCNYSCQNLHIDDMINKFELIIYMQDYLDEAGAVLQKKMAMLVPIIYEYI
jgi:hypothetical protein